MQKPMTDRELFNYALSHSQTPRALFNSDHTKRLLELFGQDDNAAQVDTSNGSFYQLRYEDLAPWLEIARQRLDKDDNERALTSALVSCFGQEGTPTAVVPEGASAIVQFLSSLAVVVGTDEEDCLQAEMRSGNAIICTITANQMVTINSIVAISSQPRPPVKALGYHVWHEVHVPATRDQPEDSDIATICETTDAWKAVAAMYQYAMSTFFERAMIAEYERRCGDTVL